MTVPEGLAQRYRRYLACLNDRRLDLLDDFVHDAVVYNGEQIGRSGYRRMLEADIAAIPDLFFDVRLLVVDGPHVACLLGFDCTPRSAFLGRAATGRPVSFTEHVFYRFRDGRIEQVWSLLDTDAIRRQLPAEDGSA